MTDPAKVQPMAHESGKPRVVPRRIRRLLARKTKQQLAEGLTPHYLDKWENRNA